MTKQIRYADGSYSREVEEQTQTTDERGEEITFPNREKAKEILRFVVSNLKRSADCQGCDCEEPWRPIEKALDEREKKMENQTQTTNTDEYLLKTLHNYFDYACSELNNPTSMYHALEGGVRRSSTIHAKRGEVCFEIILSVSAHKLSKDEV